MIIAHVDEIGAGGWVLIIGAISTAVISVIVQVWTLWVNWQREKAKIAREMLIADKVEAVKDETQKVADKLVTAHDENKASISANKDTLNEVADEVKEIKRQTNAIVQQRVDEAHAAGHARGLADRDENMP